MKGKDLTEHLLSGEEVYAGRFLHVHRDRVRLPDGSQAVREYIRHPGAVGIVAALDDRRVLLVRQYRYPHRRDFIEIPAGKLEPQEPPLETGKRELLEETGYVAGTGRAWASSTTRSPIPTRASSCGWRKAWWSRRRNSITASSSKSSRCLSRRRWR